MSLEDGRSGRDARFGTDGLLGKIEIDKAARAVRAFGRNGELVAFYPASIGSTEKPAPSGTFAVRQVVEDPVYYYDPKFAIRGVHVKHRTRVAPGPNSPVGVVSLGYPAPDRRSPSLKRGRRSVDEVVSYGSFG